ncbi:GntR family transcriptional regulator [Nocardioides insulae]|uniref:GntR family transcriptional regulator n=1 Tax=Nocardioides insulae TaxID=394734 RepID=UPI000419222E|nr:GntR family transcriptional regulator [Nocardioides insulae]
MAHTSSTHWVRELTLERTAISGSSTAARVAGVLRNYVTEGRLLPGTRLSEEDLGEALGVSRNTLREAFRLLTHERLLVHRFHRGVFVRTLAVEDVRDLYGFRRVVECSSLRRAAQAPAGALDRVRAAVEEGEAAARRSAWPEVGTANMHFHQAIVGLAGSVRLDDAASHVLAEQRLVFHVMAAPRAFHEAYLAENRHICDLLFDGRAEEAAAALERYLDEAERQLVEALTADG